MTLLDHFAEKPRLRSLWAFDKNPQPPEALSPHCRTRVWWRCARGHEWQAAVYSVAMLDSGCPYCSGRKPIPGETDLLTTHPHTAKLWHPDNPILPQQVSAGSHKKVKWKCDQGHVWEAIISSVALDGCACPYCAGKKVIPGQTDLATLFPDIAAQWDPIRNGDLTPAMVMPSGHDKVWWRCSLGHTWQALIFSRTKERSSGCPYCTGRKALAGFNDLATLKPGLAKEWYQPLNAVLRPTDVTLGSNKRVWWQCADGHIWQAAVYSRTRPRGTGCPVCAGMVRKRRSAV